MTRILPAVLLLGCGDPVEKGWSRTLDACGQLTLLDRAYPLDGGSVMFFFRSDAGVEFSVKAVHQDVTMGGNARYQEFRMRGAVNLAEAEIATRSALESRLVVLLETCSFDEAPSRFASPKPSPSTRDWLLGRLKNRDIPWSECP